MWYRHCAVEVIRKSMEATTVTWSTNDGVGTSVGPWGIDIRQRFYSQPPIGAPTVIYTKHFQFSAPPIDEIATLGRPARDTSVWPGTHPPRTGYPEGTPGSRGAPLYRPPR